MFPKIMKEFKRIDFSLSEKKKTKIWPSNRKNKFVKLIWNLVLKNQKRHNYLFKQKEIKKFAHNVT